MVISDIEKLLRDEIIEDLNAAGSAAKEDPNDAAKVKRWGYDPPDFEKGGWVPPYGYVRLKRKTWDKERSNIIKFSYILTYEIGVTQLRSVTSSAQDFCTDMLAKAENELRKNPTLDANAEDLVFGIEKEVRDVQGYEWVTMLINYRVFQDNRV